MPGWMLYLSQKTLVLTYSLNTKIVQLIENNVWFHICPEQLGRLNSKRTYEDVTENLIIGASKKC